MTSRIRNIGALLLAALTAVMLTLSLSTAASAHSGGHTGHDDASGNHSGCTGNTAPDATCSAAHAATHPGSGATDAVDNDSPADAVNVIRDYGLENAPIIIGVIGAIFLVGLTFYLVRRGLMKARGAMRL